jgi:hypothetical protein
LAEQPRQRRDGDRRPSDGRPRGAGADRARRVAGDGADARHRQDGATADVDLYRTRARLVGGPADDIADQIGRSLDAHREVAAGIAADLRPLADVRLQSTLAIPGGVARRVQRPLGRQSPQ